MKNMLFVTAAVTFSLALLTGLAPQPSIAAPADVPTVSVTDIQQAYNAECVGLMHNDYSADKQFMSPHFFSISANGKVRTLDDEIRANQRLATFITWTQCSSTPRDLWRDGNNTKVVTSNVWHALVSTSKGKLPLMSQGTSVDVWTYINGAPMQLSATDLDGVVVFNGKVMLDAASWQTTSPSILP